MQGKRQQGLSLVNIVFCKAHKSKRICEVLFDVARCQRKRCHIEGEIANERYVEKRKKKRS